VSIDITLLGTGSPMPDPNRAGPAFPPGGGDDWRELAATEFGGRIELGDDLHRVTVEKGT
jgi:ribonuclease BN (tRNA processing enzyme)